jgi:hypothetical protein
MAKHNQKGEKIPNHFSFMPGHDDGRVRVRCRSAVAVRPISYAKRAQSAPPFGPKLVCISEDDEPAEHLPPTHRLPWAPLNNKAQKHATDEPAR